MKRQKNIKCPKCNTYFTRRSHLLRHIDFFHEKGKKGQYKCDKCNKQYEYKENITKHSLKAHNAALEEMESENASLKTTFYQCHLCTKAFLTKKWYYKHLKISHPSSEKVIPLIRLM